MAFTYTRPGKARLVSTATELYGISAVRSHDPIGAELFRGLQNRSRNLFVHWNREVERGPGT